MLFVAIRDSTHAQNVKLDIVDCRAKGNMTILGASSSLHKKETQAHTRISSSRQETNVRLCMTIILENSARSNSRKINAKDEKLFIYFSFMLCD